MKATGIVRHIDDLGRIVVPREIRKRYGIEEGNAIEFFMEDDAIVLKPYRISIGDEAKSFATRVKEAYDVSEMPVRLKNGLKELVRAAEEADVELLKGRANNDR